MDKRGMDITLTKITYLILFLMLLFIVIYFYKTKLQGGLFNF